MSLYHDIKYNKCHDVLWMAIVFMELTKIAAIYRKSLI